ncbi:2,3-diaminopropionate biosynthesis protein SbnB [Candidatus Entotheonella palauensis]|uniref:2,3-diaminopropionate biosynthesis protein SbnB n=1 Tax=Candidatus Entotheonella palauensis TaxID=93172 RepID=UPI000B7CD800|nr:2,3-diaminopropionate biosynthesis protein SbnB [Candidatus Entotheonella palauensis]
MAADGVMLLQGDEVDELLMGQETAILEAVKQAYQTHARQQTDMPPDGFLRFPGKERERIIAKVAYLGGDFDVAGIKWVSSFPGNLELGLERASAALILNSTETGRPMAMMESSIISARRTGAGAALAARHLYPQEQVTSVALVGCGLINFETLRFLLTVYPMLETVHLYDLSAERAQQFCRKAQQLAPKVRCEIQATFEAVLKTSPIVAMATTAVTPHIDDLAGHQDHAVVLHTSLRDFSPQLILQGDNIVDDVDKVCSNQTSVHLAEEQVGHRNFIRSTIGDILNGDAPQHDTTKPFVIYSPFGLGILDIAVAHVTYQLAKTQQAGIFLESFLPKSWLER